MPPRISGPLMPSSESLGGLFEYLGGVSWAPWAVSGASWALLGASWRQCWLSWELIKGLIGRLRGLLEASWVPFGLSVEFLGNKKRAVAEKPRPFGWAPRRPGEQLQGNIVFPFPWGLQGLEGGA